MHSLPRLRVGAPAFGASIVALTAATTFGQVSVTLSSSAPTDNIVASYIVPSGHKDAGGLAWRANTNPSLSSDQWRDVGQMFVVEQQSVLNSITVVSTAGVNSSANTYNAAFTLSVYRFSALTDVGSAQLLASFSGTVPSSGIVNGSFINFSIPGNITLEAGQTYGFLLHFDEAADGRAISLRNQNNPGGIIVNENGRRLLRLNSIDDGTLGSLSANGQSLEFYVQASSTIPEPSAAAGLLGAGALAVCATRRRARL